MVHWPCTTGRLRRPVPTRGLSLAACPPGSTLLAYARPAATHVRRRALGIGPQRDHLGPGLDKRSMCACRYVLGRIQKD